MMLDTMGVVGGDVGLAALALALALALARSLSASKWASTLCCLLLLVVVFVGGCQPTRTCRCRLERAELRAPVATFSGHACFVKLSVFVAVLLACELSGRLLARLVVFSNRRTRRCCRRGPTPRGSRNRCTRRETDPLRGFTRPYDALLGCVHDESAHARWCGCAQPCRRMRFRAPLCRPRFLVDQRSRRFADAAPMARNGGDDAFLGTCQSLCTA